MINELLTVEEYTTPNPQCLYANDSLQAAWDLMFQSGIRHILVKNKEGLIEGVISQRDVISFSQSEDFKKITVEEVMSKDIFVVPPDTKLYEVALKMSAQKIGSAIVIDKETNFIGIFTATDALNALVEVLRGDIETI